MGQINFLQRVGHASCVRCDFETSDSMSFEEQDTAMNAHLTEKHPDWMTDGGASIRKDRLPKPAPTEAVVARMQGAIDALRHNSCPVCCGKPISGKPCVCEGSGDAVMAYGGIANILAQTELENERLKQQLEEARENLQ